MHDAFDPLEPLDPHDPMDAPADIVPSLAGRQLVLVDGRTFAISDESGKMYAPTHGMVHDDRRHLSSLEVSIRDTRVDLLASSTPDPLSAVMVSRLQHVSDATTSAVLTRRRWVASGLREDIHLHNTTPKHQRWTVSVRLAADFAHVFDVKAGRAAPQRTYVSSATDDWTIAENAGALTSTRVRVAPAPDSVDDTAGVMQWHLEVPPKSEVAITVTAEPVVDGVGAVLAFPCGIQPADAIPMRRLTSWRSTVPTIVSTDARLSVALDQALDDIAALRIIDSGHIDRAVVAAGAPWFMTLFGRDALLTSWMTLPFEPTLAAGVLLTLADLQGRTYDPVAEEEPGKILHELRRRGGGGPFAARSRYYGTVDATPLFVMLAAEAWQWGALDQRELDYISPAIDAALNWIVHHGDTNGDGLVDYERHDPSGLSNQGWKDSWDGVNFADGTLPQGPIALAEVQGYVYAALLGAAQLAPVMKLSISARELTARAATLRERFNALFWNDRDQSFAIGLDGNGRQIDSITTNPGHALWAGIAEPELATKYLDRFLEPAMWSGWGLRTLADTMAAYDPLSYHNGSVWPHDTAVCAAGAARYGRWDVVDHIIDGALDAASEFDGRPPELFAGIDRAEAPMPVRYPASCSPQAWSSASTLLHIRTMLDLKPSANRTTLDVGREDLTGITDLTLERVSYAGQALNIRIANATATVTTAAAPPSVDCRTARTP